MAGRARLIVAGLAAVLLASGGAVTAAETEAAEAATSYSRASDSWKSPLPGSEASAHAEIDGGAFSVSAAAKEPSPSANAALAWHRTGSSGGLAEVSATKTVTLEPGRYTLRAVLSDLRGSATASGDGSGEVTFYQEAFCFECRRGSRPGPVVRSPARPLGQVVGGGERSAHVVTSTVYEDLPFEVLERSAVELTVEVYSYARTGVWVQRANNVVVPHEYAVSASSGGSASAQLSGTVSIDVIRLP